MKNILDGQTDRGKTVYPPPPSGCRGIKNSIPPPPSGSRGIIIHIVFYWYSIIMQVLFECLLHRNEKFTWEN
jgi:hypothetical protein